MDAASAALSAVHNHLASPPPAEGTRAAALTTGKNGDDEIIPTAVVRSLASEPHLTIELTLAGKARFMARPKDEPLEKCLARMARSAAPPPRRGGNGGGAKQQKKKKSGSGGSGSDNEKSVPAPPPPATPLTAEQIIAATALFPPNSSSSSSSSIAHAIPGDTPNGDAWPLAAGGTLRVGGDASSPSVFRVVVNPPTVVRASLAAAAPLTGSPLCPVVDALFDDPRLARYRWFKKKRDEKENEKDDDDDAKKKNNVNGKGKGDADGDGDDDSSGWEVIEGATGAAFVPREEDVGAWLRVVVTPAARANKGGGGKGGGASSSSSSSPPSDIVLGASVSADSAVPVSPGPALPPWHGRVAERRKKDETASSASERNNAPFSTPRFPIFPNRRNRDGGVGDKKAKHQTRLRVLTYNLLADQYAASDFAKSHLFAHCHPRFLDADYRRSLGAAEVARYGADVVCLQEVDERCFSDVLLPLLRAEGYEGRFTGKASTVREGSATFWRRERFEAVSERDVVLKEVFAKLWEGSRGGGRGGGIGGGGGGGGGNGENGDGNDDKNGEEKDPLSPRAVAERHSALLPTLRSSAWLRDSLAKVSTVAQVTLLVPRGWRRKEQKEEEEGENDENPENDGTDDSDGDGPLLVTNTHLFFHPSAPHIRTLHVAAMLTEAADVARRAERAGLLLSRSCSSNSSSSSSSLSTAEAPAPIFCGDLNSDLNDGVPGAIELLREGHLPGGYWDWALGASFRYDDDGVGPPATEAKEGGGGGGGGEESAPPPPSGPLPKPFSAARGGGGGVGGGDGDGGGLCPSDLSLPFDFFPADSLQTPCTNHVRGYSGLLDFVWADRGAMRALSKKTKSDDNVDNDDDSDDDFLSPPPPPVSELGGYIPNERFPSDHLAVVADLEWLPRSQRNAGRPPPPAAAAGRGPAPPWPPPLPPQALGTVLLLPEVRIREEMREMNEKKKKSMKSSSSVASSAAAAEEEEEKTAVDLSSSLSSPAASSLSPLSSSSTSAAALMLSGKGHTVSASDPTALPACVLALRAGEILAVPTDTLYGIAACACSASAIAKVYSAKGRGGAAPLAVCVASPADVAGVADVSGLPGGLLEAMLPGPVTLLLKRRRKKKTRENDDDNGDREEEEEEEEGASSGLGGGRTAAAPSRLCAALNPTTPTVGVRVPDSQFVRSLALLHGGPIALTSANESGRPPALEASECYEGGSNSGSGRENGIAGECAAVVDGGRIPASGREGSTIVDLSSVDVNRGGGGGGEEQERNGEGSSTVGRSFSIVREGQAAAKVRELLVGFGLVEMF